jgi:two-component system LytT family response regulator
MIYLGHSNEWQTNVMTDNRKIIISKNGGLVLIPLCCIVYLKGKGMYTEIKQENKCHLVSKNLKHFESVLPSDVFTRVHQSYIINLHHLEQVCFNQKANLTLNAQTVIPLSNKYKAKIKKLLEEIYIRV